MSSLLPSLMTITSKSSVSWPRPCTASDHQAGDGAGVVIRRKEHAQPWHRGHSSAIRHGRRDLIRPWRMISFHGVNSDSIRTPLDSFEAPWRRSMKMIGDSTIAEPRVGGHERDVEQERVAVRDDAIERQPGERCAAPAAIAGRDVAHVQAGDRADIEVGERAQDDPPQRPVHDADAIEVARSNHQVGAGAASLIISGRYLGSCDRSASIWQTKSKSLSMAR